MRAAALPHHELDVDDGRLCLHEVEQFGYERLQTLGHEVTYRVLPGSTHEYLSEAALRIVADAILADG